MAWRLLSPSMPSSPSPAFLVIFFGFFILATFAIVNISSALRIYTRLLRNSGRAGIEALVHFGCLLLFACLLFAVVFGSLALRESTLLILLIPVLMLGFVHAHTLVSRLRIAAFGWGR
jgi:hypothetical protein